MILRPQTVELSVAGSTTTLVAAFDPSLIFAAFFFASASATLWSSATISTHASLHRPTYAIRWVSVSRFLVACICESGVMAFSSSNR